MIKQADKATSSAEAKDGVILKLQEDAIKQSELVIASQKLAEKNDDNYEDINFDDSQWNEIKSKSKKSKSKPLTFAEVASTLPNKLKIPSVTKGEKNSKTENHILILNPAERTDKMSNAIFAEKKQIVIKAFNDVSPKIKITHMAPTKSGGILISFPGKMFSDKASEILTKNVDKLKLSVYVPSKLQPQVEIENIDCAIPDSSLIAVLSENNLGLKNELAKENSKMEFVYSKTTRGFKKKAIFKCSANIRSEIMNNEFLSIDYDECKCIDHFFVPQCTNCGQFGHTTKKCDIQNKTVCLYCAGNHSTKECPSKYSTDKHCCNNCFTSINYSLRDIAASHNAYSRECPVYLNEVSKTALRVDYGCDYVTYNL